MPLWLQCDSMKLVEVEWLDHLAEDNWQSPTQIEAMEPATCKTVGWIVRETPLFIVVAASVAHEGDDSVEYGDLALILKSCIRRQK